MSDTREDAARSPAERRLAEARREVLVMMDCGYCMSGPPCGCFAVVDAIIVAARLAERDRLLAGQYDADVDPGAGR